MVNPQFLRPLVLLAAVLLLLSPAPTFAHGDHTSSVVKNPLKVSSTVTSGAMIDTATGNRHHVIYGPSSYSLALDVSTSSVAGRSVYFNISPLSGAVAVRGRVIDGGKNYPLNACSAGGFAAGGYRIRIAVEHLLPDGQTWIAAGWVTFAHVEGLVFNNNAIVSAGAKVAVVANEYDTKPSDGICSSAPHLHVEATTLSPHKSGYSSYSYIDPTPISSSSKLLLVGGGRTSFWQYD